MTGSEPTRCPDCGTPIRIQMPMGLCPRCLVRAAMPGPAPTVPESAAEPVVESLPRGFGDYEILEEIGHGGMGLVYKARQKSLNRIVTLKMMLGGRFATAQARARFKVEAESTAHLQHPNIVAIHEVGEHEGLPYLVMDYVAGRGLDTLAREQPLPARSAATYLAAIAEAIAYAHDKGILHRDLKPSNVLIDDSDQVRITDFGLAKRLSSTSEIVNRKSEMALTLSGEALGSPNFMPPEQAAGQHQRIGTASDVYGMGATLYFLVTGRPPFVGETISTTTRQVLESDPVAPRLLNPKVPRDLETICLKCLEKDPAKRYPTARDLAEELHRFLRDEPILARPPGVLEKCWRWCRRKPAIAAALALVACLSVFSIATAVRLQWANRGQARELYRASLAEAQSLLEHGNVDLAKATLLQCPEELRHWEWGYLMAQCHQDAVSFSIFSNGIAKVPVEGESPFMEVAFDRVKEISFDAFGRRVGVLSDGGLMGLWEALTGRFLWAQGTPNDPIRTMVFHPTNALVALRHARRLTLCSTETGAEVLPAMDLGGEILSVAWAASNEVRAAVADGDRVRFGCAQPGQTWRWQDWTAPRTEQVRLTTDGGFVALRNLRTCIVARWADGTRVGRFEADSTSPSPIRIDSQARRGVAVDSEGRIHVLNSDGTRRPSDIQSTELAQSGGLGTFSPDGRWYCLRSDTIHGGILDVETGDLLRRFSHGVVKAVFSPDNRQVLVMHDQLTATLYDLESDRVMRVLRGHGSLVGHAAFSVDGRLLATADRGGVVKVWSGRPGREFRDAGTWVHTARYSPDGRRLMIESVHDGFRIHDADSGRWMLHLHPERRFAWAVRFSPDGRFLASDDQNGGINLWDLQAGALTRNLRAKDRTAYDVDFSPDGRLLAAGHADGVAQIWDLTTERPRQTLSGHAKEVTTAKFSRDGRRLLTAGGGNPNVIIWNVETGERIREWTPHQPGTVSARFLPDGRRVATSGLDYRIRFWELDSGRLIRELTTRGMVLSWDFSPDSRRLVAWVDKMSFARQETPSLQIWDVDAGRLLLILEHHSEASRSAQFHPDRRRILASRQWEAFPWSTADYASAGPGPLSDHIARHAAEYWRERLAAEWADNPSPDVADRVVFVPFDRSKIPSRDPAAPPQLLDLTPHYTDVLDGSDLFSSTGYDEDNDLRELPVGVQRFGDVTFDVRGLIRLRELCRTKGMLRYRQDFPERTQPIPIGSKIRRLHVLGGVTLPHVHPTGSPVLRLIWRYTDGVERDSTVAYGQHLRTWYSHWDAESTVTEGKVVWTGSSPVSMTMGGHLRLYHFAMANPRPDVPVASLQWIGGLIASAPFIVAITVENP